MNGDTLNYQLSQDDFSSTRIKRLKKGDYLFHVGSAYHPYCFLILSGSLSVGLSSACGHETLLYHLGPHDLVGELGMFALKLGDLSVIADEPCELLEISIHEFREKLRTNAFLRKITDVFMNRCVQTNEVVSRLAQPYISMKICHYLKTLIESKGESKKAQVRVLLPSHGELAKLLSCQRESISRELKKLLKSGVLGNKDGNCFHVDTRNLDLFLSNQLK